MKKTYITIFLQSLEEKIGKTRVDEIKWQIFQRKRLLKATRKFNSLEEESSCVQKEWAGKT